MCRSFPLGCSPGPSKCTAAPSWVTYCSWMRPALGSGRNLFPGGVHSYVAPEENEFMVLKDELPSEGDPVREQPLGSCPHSRWGPIPAGPMLRRGSPCVWLSALLNFLEFLEFFSKRSHIILYTSPTEMGRTQPLFLFPREPV